MTIKEAIDRQRWKVENCDGCGRRKDDIESFEMAIKALEKADKYRCHDLRKDPNDLPPFNEVVLVYIVGSDIIYTLEGETISDAIERTRNCKRTSLGFYDEDEGWIGIAGYPMIIKPTAWKEIDPFEVDYGT